MTNARLMLVILMATSLCQSVQAGMILQNQRTSSWQILFFQPIGQTFTTEDQRIQSIGFWVNDLNPNTGPIDIKIELYEGAGIGRRFLGSAPIEGLYPGFNGFFDANFDFVQLDVGQMYTAIVSSPNKRPGVAWKQWACLDGTFICPDPYTGGTALVQGTIDPTTDLAFRVTPIPEPATLLLFGLGGVILRRGRKS